MLDLNTRFELLGVTLYRDADQTEVFFFLPQNPVIARDRAGLMFDLMLYEKGGQAEDLQTGGFLTLAITTGLGSLEQPLLRELRRQFGDNARLVSIPFTEGSVRLAGLDTGVAPINPDGSGPPASDPGPTGIRLVEKVFGATTPNLDGDNRAVFSLQLSEDGAAFFADLMEQGRSARPLIAIYDLKYTGLMEVESLRIEIDYSRVYDFLRTRIGFNAIVVAGEIDTIVEELRDNQAIKIDDTVRSLELSTPEAMKERRDRIDALVKELATGAFFAPSLKLGDPSVNERDVFAAPTVETQSGLFRQGLPAAIGQAMGQAVTTREMATGTDINTPPPEPGEGARPPANTQVAAQSSALGHPTATFTMRQLQQRELRKVVYDLSRTTAMQRSTGPQNPLLFMGSEREIRARIHKISLNHPFFARLRIDVDAGGTDFAVEGIRAMTVNLRYGRRPDGLPKETADVILDSADDRASFVFARDQGGDMGYEYQLTLHYLPGFGLGDTRQTVTGPWTRTEARQLSVHPSMLARRQPITLALPRVTQPDLSEVRVTVAYVDPEGVIDDRRSFVLTPGGAPAVANVRFADANDAARITGEAIFADGRSQPLPEEMRPDPAGAKPLDLVVLPIPQRPAAQFSVMLSDPLDELRSVLVDYEVRQAGQLIAAAAVEVTEALRAVPVTVVLPAPAPLPEVRLRERRIFDRGGIETLDFQPLTDGMAIVGVPAADVMEVTLRYLGPPMQTLGVLGMLVTLRYQTPDDDPQFRQTASLFLEAAEPARWVVRLKDRTARRFIHQTTLMLQTGQQRALPEVATDNNLVLLQITA
ncbi:hypothetical protein EYF88_08270 [Paracoccus sediminis]|uniref:Uncharacterized protein n=1 Tax=Paracoccus sediminis TaxID=1214787 RepID=A0A238WEG1_9RHOB|nr:hypothetical protein [Paracoccus sediminis]TBN50896.1 hypothetical protein EYF88_08270 [Paracoccus sediminis]SNR44970.1 hypothetical protein SAMN06265378_104127 [Paracoccus sediminis]